MKIQIGCILVLVANQVQAQNSERNIQDRSRYNLSQVIDKLDTVRFYQYPDYDFYENGNQKSSIELEAINKIPLVEAAGKFSKNQRREILESSSSFKKQADAYDAKRKYGPHVRQDDVYQTHFLNGQRIDNEKEYQAKFSQDPFKNRGCTLTVIDSSGSRPIDNMMRLNAGELFLDGYGDFGDESSRGFRLVREKSTGSDINIYLKCIGGADQYTSVENVVGALGLKRVKDIRNLVPLEQAKAIRIVPFKSAEISKPGVS